jgi:hypothetical protein
MSEAILLILNFGILCLTLTGFFLAVGALFPNRVARTRRMAEALPGRALGVGLVNLAFFAIVSFAFFVLADNTRIALLVVPGTVALALLLISLVFGLTGMVQIVGERLAPAQSPAARSLWGALTLCFGCAAPVVGWFFLLPFVAGLGLGGFLLSFLAAPAARPESVPAAVS